MYMREVRFVWGGVCPQRISSCSEADKQTNRQSTLYFFLPNKVESAVLA